MEHPFHIEISRLRLAGSLPFEAEVKSSFMDLQPADSLQYEGKVLVKGKIDYHPDTLHLHLTLKAKASLPCVICQNPVKVDVEVKDVHHIEMLDEVLGLELDFGDFVRDSILLETPHRAECLGKCPEREALSKHFAKEKSIQNHPFEGLELDLD